MADTHEVQAEARERAVALIQADKFAFRSCHECNAAHEHFTRDDQCVIICFGCGRYWLGGIDLTTEASDAT